MFLMFIISGKKKGKNVPIALLQVSRNKQKTIQKKQIFFYFFKWFSFHFHAEFDLIISKQGAFSLESYSEKFYLFVY